MEPYIPKAAVVAEIENLLEPVRQRLERDKNDPWDSDIAVYKFGKQLIKNINTLEEKENDFKDIKSVFEGQYLAKDEVVATIERLQDECEEQGVNNGVELLEKLFNKLDTIEVKEVDLEKELDSMITPELKFHKALPSLFDVAKHFFELGLKAQHDNWKVVDNTNFPQGDRTKIYCVFTKQQYILATVINHPQDEDLLQWKCTEFPFHRYDMCEGDKYMQII